MRLAPIACALMLVLAGCGGVMNAQTPTPTGTDADSGSDTDTPSSIAVLGGELPVDTEKVFARVLNMTERRVEAPVVHVESPDEESPAIFDRSTSPFRTALGFVPPERTNGSAGPQLGAYTPANGNSVHIYEGSTHNATNAESTLAHEFVHVVQFRTNWAETIWDSQPVIDRSLTYDGWETYYLLLEGSAEYVQGRYNQRFLSADSSRINARMAAYENASAYERWNLARYSVGAEYIAEEVDSPAGIWSYYIDPPHTTEQILHHTDDEPAALTTFHGQSGDWNVTGESAMGELFLRIALRTELNRSAAVDAAHGWGNDRRVTYRRQTEAGTNRTGTAWALRWDDPGNASEFENAFRRYLDAKATAENEVWYQNDGNATYRVERVSEENVVVFLGDESFVRAANASSRTNASVDVTVGNESPA